jgi:capsular polysaccharide transport system ATP-binding protein
MIRFINAGKAFRSRRNKRELVWQLRNFTATIPKGESTAIYSANETDRTTLIDLVAGTELLTEGEIIRTGHISWPASYRGMISSKMTGRQNLRFLTDTYGHDFNAAFDFLTDFTEIGRQMDQPVRQISGEQRNRLAIGILLAMNFEFILIDEVFEAGDAGFRTKIGEFIDSNRDKITFLMATSNIRLAQRYCSRAGILRNGEVELFENMGKASRIFRRHMEQD